MQELMKKTAVPALLAGFGSVGAYAAPITVTDSFDYADQASFQAAYNVTTTNTAGVGAAAVVSLAEDDLNLVTGAGVGGGTTTVTNDTLAFELDADTGITVSFDVQASGFNGFSRLRLGVSSVTDPSERLFFQVENRVTNGTQFRVFSTGDTGGGILATVNSTSTSERGGSFVFDIDGATATVTRDGVSLGALAGLDISDPGEADYSRFADGVNLFVEINRQSSNTANGTATIDNLSVTGTLIPEPSSLALASLGAVCMLRRRGR